MLLKIETTFFLVIAKETKALDERMKNLFYVQIEIVSAV